VEFKFKVGDSVKFVEHNCDDDYFEIGEFFTITSLVDDESSPAYYFENPHMFVYESQIEPKYTTFAEASKKIVEDAMNTIYERSGASCGEEPKKYNAGGDGFLYSDLLGALERHLAKFKSGINVDDESSLEHIVQVAVNAMFLYNYRISGKGIDDRIELTKSE
jgi:hypothetical protein